jgi:6-methylsalicylate decarboxylase
MTDASTYSQLARRTFIGAAATAWLAWWRSAAQSTGGARRIDVHHHFLSPAYTAFAKSNNQSPGLMMANRSGPDSPWDLAKDLDDMDRAQTAVAILSITTPGFWFGKQDEVRKVMRESNEFAAKLQADHPGRFGSFACIPLTDTDGSLKEIEHALDKLQADGIGLFSNYRDRWLGHESFAPVYEELNRRRALVFVHPITAACCTNLVPGVADTLIEYGADTARAVASLIYSGTTVKFPQIRWIFSHGGGIVPFVVERFLGGAQAEIVPGVVTKGQDGPPPKNVPGGTLAEIRKMHFDTAQVSNPVALGALRKVVPLSQILFGTDYWYRTAEETVRNLMAAKVFTEHELRTISRDNAERLLPRYKA